MIVSLPFSTLALILNASIAKPWVTSWDEKMILTGIPFYSDRTWGKFILLADISITWILSALTGTFSGSATAGELMEKAGDIIIIITAIINKACFFVIGDIFSNGRSMLSS